MKKNQFNESLKYIRTMLVGNDKIWGDGLGVRRIKHNYFEPNWRGFQIPHAQNILYIVNKYWSSHGNNLFRFGEGDKETYTTKAFYGLIIQPIYDLILPHTSAFNLMQHFFCKCFHQCKKNCLCFKNFNDVNINNFFICWFCKFLVYLALIMLLAPEFFSLCSLLYLKLSYSFIVFLQIYRLSRLI